MEKEENVVVEEIMHHQKAILNLQRSNVEMMEFDKDDVDFILAIKENKVIIENKLKHIEELKNMLPKETKLHLDIEDGLEL
jgi:hypothetical protein